MPILTARPRPPPPPPPPPGPPARAANPGGAGVGGGAGRPRGGGAPAHLVRLPPEEVALDPPAGDVPVGGQAHQAAGAQPLREDAEPLHAAGRREHLETEPLTE